MGAQGKLQIDSSHCRAICDEIGERLRVILTRDTSAMPPHLQLLLDRLAAKDRELAPRSCPPDDMVWRSQESPIGLTQAA